MGLEAATYPNQLIAANPASGDPKSQGDDHIRMLKTVLLSTFPNVGGPVPATDADLAALAGAATSGVNINVVTQSAADNSTKAASTAMVQNAILASSGITASLPAQPGNAGYSLITNGTTPSWGIPVHTAAAILNYFGN